jgi:hypothetical protein
MADPAQTVDQNLLPVQAYFAVDGTFQTFIGQGQPFYATVNPYQSGLHITNSTIDSTTIGATTPSTGVFTNILTTTGQILTSPTANTDIANKAYVDSIAQGLSPKGAVKCATTANITLSGLQTIDTYTTLSGDRVLVKNQTNSAENGIYIASSSAWTRSTDMDVWSEVPGAYTVVINGATNGNTSWVTTAADTGTIGVTAMPWVQFSVSGTYFAGTGLTLISNTFSITNTGVVAGSYGSASQTLVATVNAQGQLTSLSASSIAISASQTTSGTFSSSLLSGSYTGITGVGTLTVGTWNASTVTVPYGGTGATTLTGYVKGSGTSAFTASATIPTTDLSGTITNAQLQNSTISGVSLGSNLYSLTIGTGLTGTSYNGSAAVTITNSSPMVYPPSGIPNSTGTAWGTSYSTTGTGTVVALATAPTLNNPTISNYETYSGSSSPTYTAGRVWYDSGIAAMSYYNDTTDNIVRMGYQLQQQARNSTGSTITKGQVVYISGSTGQIGNIILAQANSYAASQVIGIANQDIPNNTNGYIVIYGTVENVNTASLTAGNNIYLSATTAGALTQTEPSAPNYAVHMGVCLYSNTNNGKLLIVPNNKSIDTGYIIGQVAIAQGGTNGTATPTAGGIAYGSGTAYAFTTAGTTGQVLTSAGSGTPTWTTPTSYATVTDDTTTNATRYPLFAAATSGNLTTEYVASTKYQFNPSTGVLTATGFSGSGASLTSLTAGNLSGTIPSAVLGNSSLYIGTTAIALNRASASQSLTGVNIDGSAGSATTATTATNATNTAITDDTTTATTVYPTWVTSTTGNLPQKTASTKLNFVPSTGVLSATSYSGAGTGLTGTASSLSIGGNAATATSATTATNIAGGANLQIPYNTGSGATSFITAPTTASTYLQYNGTGFAWASAAGLGTVTSVALSLPSIFTVSGSPVTTSGTLTGTFNTQNANLVFAGPSSGVAATPTFRSLVSADIPNPALTTKTTTYTITATDGTILCDATSAAFTVTLPTAVSATGKTYIVKKIDSSANAVTIATTSSQTIDTISTQVLGIQSAWLVIQSDGSNWQIVG